MSKVDKNPPAGTRIELPAIRLPVTGLRAGSYVVRQSGKLGRYPLDAGMDLYPSEIKQVVSHGRLRVIWVHTFLEVHIGPGFRGRIVSRSSSLEKLRGGDVEPGVIDAGYQGELIIRVKCHLEDETGVLESIKTCQQNSVAIAQLLLEQSITILPFEPPTPPPPTDRGSKGFGSSDKIIEFQ